MRIEGALPIVTCSASYALSLSTQAQPVARHYVEVCLLLVGGVFCMQHECKNYYILCVCGL